MKRFFTKTPVASFSSVKVFGLGLQTLEKNLSS